MTAWLRTVLARVAAWINQAGERDVYFWLGLLLIGMGVARAFSAAWAELVIGIALLAVAVFGVASAGGHN